MKRKTDSGQNAHSTDTRILRIYKGDLNFEFQLLSFLPGIFDTNKRQKVFKNCFVVVFLGIMPNVVKFN
ncbi:hypothetical protein NIES4073_77650 [Kalymmatonema gypsitolerans NIES-4073]|nr:hypothetical protein NIES4073_77650 [Scytonema sp. NIES-4073]